MNIRKVRPMKVIVAIWLFSYIVVILPTFYLLKTQGVRYVIKLWGFAPNQFLFTVVYFPMAAWVVLLSVVHIYQNVYNLLPLSHPFRIWMQHWPATLLIAISISGIISLVVYWNSIWSIDKLYPYISEIILESMREFEEGVSSVSLRDEERENYRTRLVQESRNYVDEVIDSNIASLRDKEKLINFLHSLPPAVRLQILLTPKFQHSLGLLDPALVTLNVFQILIQVTYALLLISIAIALAIIARILDYNGSNYIEVTKGYHLIFVSAAIFGIFPVLYSQFRKQIEYYIGLGNTILQDVFSGLLVVVFLLWLRMEVPQYREVSLYNIFVRYVPIFFIGIGPSISWIEPAFLEQLIGKSTNPGVQILLSLFSIVIFIFVLLKILFQ